MYNFNLVILLYRMEENEKSRSWGGISIFTADVVRREGIHIEREEEEVG